MKKYNIILFDLDGTLTDPKEGITKSVQYALNKMGIKEENRDNLVKFIGPPLMESFQEYYNMDPEKAWQAVETYREYFAVEGIFDNQVYPGIPDLLKDLKDRGYRLAVATSKPTVFSKQVLTYFDIACYFDVVIGSNLDGSRVAKNEIIEVAVKTLKANNHNEIVMIGDRKHDIIGAKKNNIDSIGVTYGYGTKIELQQAGANYIVNSVEELGRLLS